MFILKLIGKIIGKILGFAVGIFIIYLVFKYGLKHIFGF